MELKERLWRLLIVSICVLYVLLRFWNLTETCLWFDEIFSVHAATQDWQNLFWFVAQDLIHPPLFYVLLKIWISVGGESLFWLRLFPVLFSTAALLPFYFLCRHLKINFPAIALTFSFLAFNGALIKYAQEVRMYAVLLCLSLFSLWLFVRFLNLGKSFVALTIINVLLVYTHYFGWLVVLTEIAAIVVFQRIKLRQILIMLAAAALSFLPWVLMVWRAAQINADFSQNLSWAAKPDLTNILQFVFDLLEPFYFQQTSVDQSSIFIVTAPILLLTVIAFAAYFSNWKIENETEKNNFILLAIFCSAPVLLAFLASWILPVSVWGTRHLIIVFAPFAILSALAISKISNLYLKLTVLALVFWLTGIAFLLQSLRGTPVLIGCAWGNLATDLRLEQQKLNSPLKIYVFEDVVAYDFWFAFRGDKERFQIIKVNDIPGLSEDAAYFLPRGFDEVRKTDENGFEGERFFIAFRDTEWNENKAPLQNLIKRNYRISEPHVFEAQGVKAFLILVERRR